MVGYSERWDHTAGRKESASEYAINVRPGAAERGDLDEAGKRRLVADGA